MNDGNYRIYGYDLARVLALLGLIIYDSKTYFGISDGSSTLQWIVSLLDGRAMALFTLLGGAVVGLYAKQEQFIADLEPLNKKRRTMIRRSLIFMALGLFIGQYWPTEIFTASSLMLMMGVPLFVRSNKSLTIVAAMLIFGFLLFPLLGLPYSTGWESGTYAHSRFYEDFWTWKGMLRYLFYNGLYPLFPWGAFFVIGMWLARFDIKNDVVKNRILLTAGVLTVLSFSVSELYVRLTEAGFANLHFRHSETYFSTSFMPPGPLFIINATGIAIIITIFAVNFAEKHADAFWLKPLVHCGQTVWSIYLIHILIGIFSPELTFIPKEFKSGIAILYGVSVFTIGAILAHLWKLRFKHGPVEWLLKQI